MSVFGPRTKSNDSCALCRHLSIRHTSCIDAPGDKIDDDGPLADGWLDGTAIECPRHGARFDVTTGKVLCLPAAVPINAYPVKVEGDHVKVNVSEPVPK